MDDWTYPYPDVAPPGTHPALLDQDWSLIVARGAPAQQEEAARGVAELEQTQALDAAGSPAEAEVPLPFATRPGVALTF